MAVDELSPFAKLLNDNPQVLQEAEINTPERYTSFLAQLKHESGLQPISERPSQYASSQMEYKGRGFIQLTHEDNYKKYGQMIGEDLHSNPERANDPVTALKVAAAYWKHNGLNELADAGDYNTISQRIGGTNYHGHNSRVANLEASKKAWATANGDYVQAAQLLSAKTNRPLVKENTGTEYMLENAGNITPRTSFSEMFKQGTASAYQSQSYRLEETQREIMRETGAQAKKDLGIDLEALIQQDMKKQDPNYGKVSTTPMRGGPIPIPTTADYHLAYDNAIAQLKAENPGFHPKYGRSLDVATEAGQRIGRFEREYQDSKEAATFTQKIGGTMGSMYGFMKDPFNVMAMVATSGMGPTGAGVKAWAGRAGVNMASEVPIQAALQPELDKVGLPSGFQEGLVNVLSVGAGSLGFEALMKGLRYGLSKALNKGVDGWRQVAKTFKSDSIEPSTSPLGDRVANSAGEHLEAHADALEGAPGASTVIGRQNFVEKLDAADTQVTLGKPADVIPSGSPTYYKPISSETADIIDKVVSELDPEDAARIKAEQSEWDMAQKTAASGTEEQAAMVKASPQENPKVREQYYHEVREYSAEAQKVLDDPAYAGHISQEFDNTILPFADNIEFSIVATTKDIDITTQRLARDQATLRNWGKIEADGNIKDHLKSPAAKRHIEQRIKDQEIQLQNREKYLEQLNEMKAYQEADIAQGKTPSQTIHVEDDFGNITTKPAGEVFQEVIEKRTLLTEFMDCIKKGGIS